MRTTISIDDKVAEAGQAMADKETRGNFSMLCEKALIEYCGAREPSGSDPEIAAAVKTMGATRALKALRREARKAA